MGDFFRHWWALLYWNARKSAFVVGRRRGRCPCQSPSDSGRAGVTHCDAAMGWDRPGRFRRVCPVLQQSPQGWMCGVDTAAVRPYWGRAFAWWAGAALAMYVVAACVAAGVLRGRGYRDITPLDTLLPSRWSRVAAARRDIFLRQAHDAIARRDMAALWVSLSSASAAAPDDYEARLAVAQVYSHLLMSSPAEAEFRDLLERFPAERARTAVVFHDVLVTLGDFDGLGRLALRQLANSDTPEKPAWMHALMLALRGTPTPGALLRSEGEALRALPAAWQTAVEAEAAVRSGDLAVLQRWPSVPVVAENAALLIAGAETLAEHASATVAIDAIVRARPAIGAFESERLLHRLQSRLKAAKLALKSFDAMLTHARTPPERERLVAALVEFPDFDSVGRFTSALTNPGTPFTANEAGSVWVAAVLAGHESIRELAAARLRKDHAVTLGPDLPRTLSPAAITAWMKLVPLSRETAAALAIKSARLRAGVAAN